MILKGFPTDGAPAMSYIGAPGGSMVGFPTGPPGTYAWDDVTDKPSTFPPDVHNHATAAVTGLDAALSALGSADVALDGRLDTAEADITALEAADTALDVRLDTAETDITALEAADIALDGRLDLAEADISDLEDAIPPVLHYPSTAVGNGTTDDRAALAADDAAALAAGLPLLLEAGTYRIASTITINSRVVFAQGAIIKPDASASVVLAANITATPLSKIFDISTGGVVRAKAPVCYAEWWGAVGDGTTDDGLPLRAAFLNTFTTGGLTLHLVSGRTYASSLPFDIKSNTYVFGGGVLKCLVDNPALTGGFVLFKNAARNVVWVGPTLDINGKKNANGFCVGDVPTTTDFTSDIYIAAAVRGTRVDPAIEVQNDTLYAGGGKGLTVQFRARNVYANIRAEDCDIACSIESAVSEVRHIENVVVDLFAKDSHRTALFLSGSKDPAISSLDSAGFSHSIYPGCKVRLRAMGGQDASITNPVTSVVGTNYDHAGVVTMNYASGIDLEVYAATSARCTLIRGMATASTIRVTNALMDELQDGWDTRHIDTLPAVPTMMSDNVFEANIHAQTHHGVLVRPHRDPDASATRTLVKSRIEVDTWCKNGVGAITQSDGTTDEFAASVAYRFRDMTASPVKEIVGNSSHNAKPQWSLAANGGGVAARRESWHDGTREVAAFDATSGWRFPNLHWDEKPLILGTAGVSRRWLHYDSTQQIFRVTGSAPASESSGSVFSLHNYSADEVAGTAIPSAQGKSLIRTANTAATTITNFTGGYNGKLLTVLFNDAKTTVAHNSTIKLRGGYNKTFQALSTLTLVYLSGVWYEIGDAGSSARIVTPEDFGAVGDGVTDDGAALVAMFQTYAAANGGARIHIPAGKIYATSLAFEVQSNTYVFGGGTIKCLIDTPGGRGAVVLMVNGAQKIVWDGPTVDGNGTTNANCIAIGIGLGFDPLTTPFNSDIYINATVKGARVSTTVENTNNVLYSGGGKGFSIQSRTKNVYANIRAEDCDVSATIEAVPDASGVEDRSVHNIVLDLQSKDAHRTALLLFGGTPAGVGSSVSARYTHSLHPGVKVRLRAMGGQDVNITDPVADTTHPNYELAGVVTSQGANGVDLEVYAATTARCTLLRGKMFGSRVKINAFMDELQDVWDSRIIAGTPSIFQNMMDNVLEANVHMTTHHGVLVRPHRVSGSTTMRRTQLDVSTWCENGVGAITQDDGGTTDSFGLSVTYRFRDMKSSPVKDIVGSSSHNAKPQWSIAASGGVVAARRESWHDGTGEAAVFDATNGWHFPRTAYNERPVVLGTAGTARRWLHYDGTNQLLRFAGSAPASESAGAAFALFNYSADETAGTAIPSALGKSLIRTANTAPTTITNFTGGFNSKLITVLFNDAFTTVAHNATIKLRAGVAVTFPALSTLTLVYLSGVWYEVSSSKPDRTVQTVTSAVTVAADADQVVFIGSSGAPTLPTAVGNTARYTFKNTHTGDRTIATTSSQTIDGSTTLVLPPGASVDVVSDGANWRII